MKYYPAFLDLRNRLAVVVGGGAVAERKVHSLIKAGASVKLVSPDISANLEKQRDKKAIQHIKRNYRKGDLKGAFIVIAATSSDEVNSRVAKDAGQLVNVVGSPSEGNFIVPSLLSKGSLSLAISTEGASPAISKAIRKELEGFISPGLERYLRFIEQVRKRAIGQIGNERKRRRFLRSLASEKRLETLKNNGFDMLSKEILSELKELSG